jgi:hypothetical protein
MNSILVKRNDTVDKLWTNYYTAPVSETARPFSRFMRTTTMRKRKARKKR